MATLDQIFDLLSKRRRRYVLYYLEQHDGPVSVDDLAEAVAEWERDPASVQITDGGSTRIEIELKHNHLPRADAADLVEYDPEANVVRITDDSVEFEAILTVARLVERPSTDD